MIETGLHCKTCNGSIVLHKWGGKVKFETLRSKDLIIPFAWVSAKPYCSDCGIVYDPSYISEKIKKEFA